MQNNVIYILSFINCKVNIIIFSKFSLPAGGITNTWPPVVPGAWDRKCSHRTPSFYR